MLLLLGFGGDFGGDFGQLVNFSLYFKVLPSRELCFSNCFCSIFSRFFQQLLSNFDLFDSSILALNAASSSNCSSNFFTFRVQTILLTNLTFFLCILRLASLSILRVLHFLLFITVTEIYDVSEVSEDALERARLGKFGFS